MQLSSEMICRLRDMPIGAYVNLPPPGRGIAMTIWRDGPDVWCRFSPYWTTYSWPELLISLTAELTP
jgi:hypothetical protein